MLVITAERLTPNADGPAHREFVGGLLICNAHEDGTKDYAGVVVDKDAGPVRYLALDGDMNEEGWAPVAQRALEHPGFEGVPDHWIELLAQLVSEAQEAGCLNGPSQTSSGPGPRHLTPLDPQDVDPTKT